MKRYKTGMLMLAALCALAACESERVEVLKSPCVGIEGSPCGPKRDVNGWFMHSQPADHS